jgi:hypothetical protein
MDAGIVTLGLRMLSRSRVQNPSQVSGQSGNGERKTYAGV